MKRVLLIALALMLCFTALADRITPSAFMNGRGLMVLDSNELESMLGIELSFDPNIGYTLAVFLVDDPIFGNLITWYENGVQYLTVDLMALFGGGVTTTKKGLCQVFIDFCKTFSFDFYMFTTENTTYYIPGTFSGQLKEQSFVNRFSTTGDQMNRYYLQSSFFTDIAKAVS